MGDSVLGYDLRTLHLVGVEEADLAGAPLEVYLVKKKRPERPGPTPFGSFDPLRSTIESRHKRFMKLKQILLLVPDEVHTERHI